MGRKKKNTDRSSWGEELAEGEHVYLDHSGPSGVSALVVDDYGEHADILCQTLSMYGVQARAYKVGGKDEREHFGSAFRALSLAVNWSPNLIIVDSLLAGIRSWQFIHELLKYEPTPRPYIVSLTGFASPLQRRLNEECGSDEYVTKPIELSTLLTWVQKARQRREASGMAENRHDASDRT